MTKKRKKNNLYIFLIHGKHKKSRKCDFFSPHQIIVKFHSVFGKLITDDIAWMVTMS